MPVAWLGYNIDKFDYVKGGLLEEDPPPLSAPFIYIGHNPSRTPKSVLLHNWDTLEILKTDIPYGDVTLNKISKQTFRQEILDVPFEGVLVVRRAKRRGGRNYCKFECLGETTLGTLFKYELL